jgi:glycosyltransferase involved in cell wall biosynthesis
VSVVIPTLSRPSLYRAVRSVLEQTYPVDEIIVVADTDLPVTMPPDDRIVVLRSGGRAGPARCRQLGIDAAHGAVIALLDDDDEWCRVKLERQLAAVAKDVASGKPWIASSRMVVAGPGERRRIWPRRLAASDQSVAEYLYRFTGFTVGGAALQTSTLCFPAELVHLVPWDVDPDAPHEEASWLLRVRRAVPDLRLVHHPGVLSTYNVDGSSLSRAPTDRTDEYLAWGLRNLGEESPRVRGDYLSTSPVSAAVSARSLAGVRRSAWSAIRYGRPGPFAVVYAILGAARILVRSVLAPVR